MDGAFVIVIAFAVGVLLTSAAIAGSRGKGKAVGYSLPAIALMILGSVGISSSAKSPTVHKEPAKNHTPSDPSISTPRHDDVASNP